MSDYLNKRGGFSGNSDREKFLLIAAGGAFLSLLMVVVAVFSIKSKEEKPKQVEAQLLQPESATVTLYSVERPVRVGAKLTDVKFKEIVWPRNQIPEGAIRDLAQIKDKFAKETLEPGTPITSSLISNEPVTVSLPLTPGMRAITIEVDETASIEGYARPGTRVDVTLTFMNDKQLATRVLVPNARVLSFGGDMSQGVRPGQGGSRIVSKSTITLEVSAEEALSIQTARQLGRLGLIMRDASDDKAPEVDSVSQSKIIDPGATTKKNKQVDCQAGTMKIGDKEFIVPCDGKGGLIPVE